MKRRLTKFFTVLLTVMLVVGMAPATGSAAYAASWNSGSFSSWLGGLFGNSSNENTTEQNSNQQEDVVQNPIANNSLETTSNDGGGTNNQEPLVLTKKINDNGNKITLEAYATGKVKKVDTYTPTDIVLVLDQSGSMEQALGDVTRVYSSDLDTTKTYLRMTANNSSSDIRYEPLTYSNGSWKNASGRTYTPKQSSSSRYGTQFYEGTTKLQALKSSVKLFVQNIEKSIHDSENKAEYRVSIVGYSSENNTKLLTGTTVSDTLQSVNSDAGKTNIMNAINGLYGNGSTRADLGISFANNIFEANPIPDGEKRNRAVIMFTDGEPNNSNGFEHQVAIDAINYANTTKNTYKASVFTVGILNNADPTADFTEDYSNNSSERINRYMHYVSSNYPNASGSYDTSYDWWGNASYSKFAYTAGADKDKTRGFYMTAKDASGLNKIFENIAGSIEKPSSSIDLGSQASLRDIVSDDFHLPQGTSEDNIIVKTAKYAGKGINGELTWKTAQVLNNAQVSIDNKTINVTNFSYKDNYVLDTSDGPVGYKLIVEIPVEINRTFGGNNIESNASAGIYETTTSEDAIITALSPKVDAPIDYEIGGTTQTIPDGSNVTKESLFEYVKADDGFEYTPDGSKNKFVDLTYTIKDASGNIVGIYTIEAGDTTGTWTSVDESKITGLHYDTEYSIECKITPITEGTAIETTKTATSYVYVDGVTRAFVIDFGKPVTYTKEQVFTENQLSSQDKINQISYKEGTNVYGDLTLNNDKSITYKLKKFMDGIDTYTFNVANKCTQTVKMIPATSVYYEDNFGEETDADGKVTNSIITYDDNWTVVNDGNVVTSINGEDPVGYDSAYEGNTKFSSGSAHMAKATDTAIKATFKFTGSGIDLYGYTDNNTGRMRIQLYKLNENDERISNTATYTAIVDTKYNSGKVYQTPLFSYMGEETCRYEAVVTVGKGSAIYLDAMRVYYPIGNTNENYTDDENAIKYVDIRDQIFAPQYFSVDGTLFVDEHADGHDTVVAHTIKLSDEAGKAEYSTYGRKREVAIAPGDSVTLSGFADNVSVKQIGMRTNSEAPEEFKITNPTGKVDVNGSEIALTSATDMYYNVTVKDGKLVITNNTNYIITLTNLKLK